MKRLGFLRSIGLILSLLLAVPAYAVTDSFTGSAGTALGTYSANWTVKVNAGDVVIAVGGVGASLTTNTSAVAFYNATSAANDQFAQGTLNFQGYPTSNEAVGVCVRVNSSGSGYCATFYIANNQAYIVNMVAGVFTGVVIADGTSWTPGDVMRLEVVGTTLTLKRNGTTTASQADSTYTAGQYGIGFWGGPESNVNLSNWSAGDIGGGGGPTINNMLLRGAP